MLNSGKLSVTANLKSAGGLELATELALKADVLVENFAPGVLDRLGLGYSVLSARNPALVYASGSGYGSDGPYRDYPAMDLTVQAISGGLGARALGGVDVLVADADLAEAQGAMATAGLNATGAPVWSRHGRAASRAPILFEAPALTVALHLAPAGHALTATTLTS